MGNTPPSLSKVKFAKTGSGVHTIYHPVVNGKIYHSKDYFQFMLYAKIVNEKNVEITYTEEHNPNKVISFDDKKTTTQFLKALHFCISFQCGDDSIWTFIDGKVLFFNYCQYLKVEKNKITIKYNSDICTNGVHVINY